MFNHLSICTACRKIEWVKIFIAIIVPGTGAGGDEETVKAEPDIGIGVFRTENMVP